MTRAVVIPVRGHRPTWLGLILVAALLLVPLSAFSQTEETGGPVESPQRFAFELRFGPYYPEVDDGLNGSPYATIFGDSSDLMTEFEFDYQPARIFVGTFGIGAAIGFMHASDKAMVHDDSTQRSEDETGLWILPLSLLAVVRFDIFAERWNVPLVPFVKFGFTYSIWWTTNENGVSTGTDSGGDSVSGYGGSAGLRLGGGIMLRLDWIEPTAARTFDNAFGVNHSYIIFEYYWAWVDGFGAEGRMDVGDANWILGLALEF